MATPKEQRDARPNARTTGPLHHRSAPADAVGFHDRGGGQASAASAPEASRDAAGTAASERGDATATPPGRVP